jgi:nucleoid-associated protein YgaU
VAIAALMVAWTGGAEPPGSAPLGAVVGASPAIVVIEPPTAPDDRTSQAQGGTALPLLEAGRPAAIVETSAAPVAPAERLWVVRRGDHLTSIATRFCVTPAILAAANNIADPDLIALGDVIRIPADPLGATCLQ